MTENSNKSNLPPNLHLDTLAVRMGLPPSQYGENSEALFLTSGYVQSSAESSARRFAGEEDGYTYGRGGNPTVTSFEMRLGCPGRYRSCYFNVIGHVGHHADAV